MRKCPDCGSRNIKEETDRSKIIGYLLHEPIYEKILVCKNCTNRWKPGEEPSETPKPVTVMPEAPPEVPESPPEVPESPPEEPEAPPEEPESPPEEPEAPPEEPPTSD